MIGVTVLRHESFIANLHSEIVLAVLCLFIGIASNYFLNAKEVMDIYHNIVVLPLLAYLLITILPVIFEHGTATEKTTVVILVAIWALLLWYDMATGRLDQQRWLATNHQWPMHK